MGTQFHEILSHVYICITVPIRSRRELKRSVRALLPEGKALRLAADTGRIRNLSMERAELHLSHLEPWVLSTLSLCHEEQQGGLELRLLTVSYHSPDPPKDPKGQGTRTT